MAAIRHCGACRRSLRFDERLETTQIEVELTEGVREVQTVQACSTCRGEDGEPVTYPIGSDIPTINAAGRHMPICAICRLALFEDDQAQAIRIDQADIDAAGADLEPGIRHACRDCVNFWKPYLAQRLGVDVRHLHGRRLM